MSISVQKLTYTHPDKEVLFKDLSFSLSKGEKVTLIGNNGTGKSTFLQILCGQKEATEGNIVVSSRPYYIPQHFGQYDNLTIAEALNIDNKLHAFNEILKGNVEEENFNILNDEWDIEEKAISALHEWGLDYLSLNDAFSKLSGGEKTKVFLAGISIHQPEIILMDEPSNHMDTKGRKQLYGFIESTNATLLIISHDRTLLNLLYLTYELHRDHIKFYNGNYESYKIQKEQELNALQSQLEEKEKELRLAKKIARETAERKQKHESRGQKLSMKKGVGKMAMDTLQDKAEKSNKKMNDRHTRKIDNLSQSLSEVRAVLPNQKAMKTDFHTSELHAGKTLIKLTDVNIRYEKEYLWKKNLNLEIKSGQRIAIKGNNGCGKTSLLKLITEELKPAIGNIDNLGFNYVFLDQDYNLIDNHLTIYEQATTFNKGLLEHEIKTILNRFLFSKEVWNKECSKLSGGEKMKLALCCLMINSNTPDMFILDEPTNNIDLHNIGILTHTLKEYQGTILVVSHDQHFLEEIKINSVIEL